MEQLFSLLAEGRGYIKQTEDPILHQYSEVPIPKNMDSEKAMTVFLLLGLGLVSASPENFCKSLTDFSGRVDVLEDRTFCISNLMNVCEEVTQEHCMEVDQFDCEVIK